MTQTFVTASELSREIGQPLSRILAAIESGKIRPAGRAGAAANAAFIFSARDIPTVRECIAGEPHASAPGPHKCQNVAEVKAKASALRRAMQEAQ